MDLSRFEEILDDVIQSCDAEKIVAAIDFDRVAGWSPQERDLFMLGNIALIEFLTLNTHRKHFGLSHQVMEEYKTVRESIILKAVTAHIIDLGDVEKIYPPSEFGELLRAHIKARQKHIINESAEIARKFMQEKTDEN